MKTIKIKQKDLIWLAGLVEGDGCFTLSNKFRPTIQIKMIDEDVVLKASAIMGCKVFHREDGRKNHKDNFCIQLSGNNAIDLMYFLRPHMGTRRTQKIDDIVEAYGSFQKNINKPCVKLKDIKPEILKDAKLMSYRELGRKYHCSHESIRRLLLNLYTGDFSKNKIQYSITDVESDDEINWIAGILEAEGSFMKGPPSRPNSPVISLQTTDLDVAERCGAYLKSSISSYTPKGQNALGESRKKVYALSVKGKRARETMAILKPMMGIRRQKQIEDALNSYDPLAQKKASDNKRKLSNEDVVFIQEQLLNKSASMRKLAKMFSVHHETIRYALANYASS